VLFAQAGRSRTIRCCQGMLHRFGDQPLLLVPRTGTSVQ
jgi:hypothetical protein